MDYFYVKEVLTEETKNEHYQHGVWRRDERPAPPPDNERVEGGAVVVGVRTCARAAHTPLTGATAPPAC